jgi:hypothetical protein
MGGSGACVPNYGGEEAAGGENGEQGRRKLVNVGIAPPAVKEEWNEKD